VLIAARFRFFVDLKKPRILKVIQNLLFLMDINIGFNMTWWMWLIIIIFVWGWISNHNLKKRKESLILKYKDEKLVQRILKKQIWQGQTEGQLLDSIGKPDDVAQNVLKTKVKYTWKYRESGSRRLKVSIIIEDGLVVGWNNNRHK
jgi:predicted membrane protein